MIACFLRFIDKPQIIVANKKSKQNVTICRPDCSIAGAEQPFEPPCRLH